jgi:ubiquinone/menaquinone biosynthesis C-methylase UbiE
VTLLDIGCGNGGFADGLEDVIERYIGVDPASEMLRLGRSRDGYAYVSGVGEAIPLSDGVADVVVLKTVLTHCYAPEAVLRETARASKPGSLIVISTANGRAWYHPLRLLRRRLARPGDAPDGYLYTFDATRLTQLVADAGLTPRVWRTLGYGVLPRVVDGRLSKRRVERFCNLADAIGGRFFPSRGGALILVAEKPK